MSRTLLISLIAACTSACAYETGEASPPPEAVGSSQSALVDWAGATFEQILTHVQPADRFTHVCEMTIPNLDPNGEPLNISVTELEDLEAPNIYDAQYTWTGADIADPTVGKASDRIEVTGCSAGGDCRLSIRMRTKTTRLLHLGCEISVTGQANHHGFSIGNMVYSSCNGPICSDVAPIKAQGRQKMILNPAGTSLAHYCVARVYDPTPATGDAGYRLRINGVNPGSPVVILTDGVPVFPSVVDFSPMPGYSVWGTDSVSTKVKHIVPRTGGLAPGDYVWCEAVARNGVNGNNHGAVFNYNQPPTTSTNPGMTFE